MNEIELQMQLLLFSIGNVIDDDNSVEHITLPEIWQWLNDILSASIGDD
jgi:hypothetical protein